MKKNEMDFDTCLNVLTKMVNLCGQLRQRLIASFSDDHLIIHAIEISGRLRLSE